MKPPALASRSSPLRPVPVPVLFMPNQPRKQGPWVPRLHSWQETLVRQQEVQQAGSF